MLRSSAARLVQVRRCGAYLAFIAVSTVLAALPTTASQLPAADVALDAIAAAINAGDHLALAEFVHPDGVALALTTGAGPARELTPDQALYRLKSFFRNHETLRFVYTRRQTTGPDRAVGVASWRHRRIDGGGGERNILRGAGRHGTRRDTTSH